MWLCPGWTFRIIIAQRSPLAIEIHVVYPSINHWTGQRQLHSAWLPGRWRKVARTINRLPVITRGNHYYISYIYICVLIISNSECGVGNTVHGILQKSLQQCDWFVHTSQLKRLFSNVIQDSSNEPAQDSFKGHIDAIGKAFDCERHESCWFRPTKLHPVGTRTFTTRRSMTYCTMKKQAQGDG
jgi:hypothetical protein